MSVIVLSAPDRDQPESDEQEPAEVAAWQIQPGRNGALISANANGAPSGKTTVETAMHGPISVTIRRGPALTAGVRTAWLGFLMINRTSASHWPCGMARIRFSRSACSG